MRLVSHDGMIDVNYDNGSLVVGVGKYEECISAIISYYDHSCQKGTKLAEYSSKAKAIKVMEMLKEEYLKYLYGAGGEIATRDLYIQPFAFLPPKVFKFPKDEEIEV